MKLSTKSRYGTRLMVELAQHYDHKGFTQLKEIARSQEISLKYLEQIIMPLKRARYVTSIRGARGGYRLAKPPGEITVGEIVALLEEGTSFIECAENPEACDRASTCLTRDIWQKTSEAIYERLNAITLSDLL